MESMSYIYLAMTDADAQPVTGYDAVAAIPAPLAHLPVVHLPEPQVIVTDDCDRQEPLYPTLYF